MYILRAWRDSLSLLAPSNLKLFLLVTLKSTWETYKILFTRWVPIVVMASVVGVTYILKTILLPSILTTTFPPSYLGLYILFLLLQSFLVYIQLYLGYAATRPSIGIKNDAYFLHFWRHTCLLMLIPISIIALFYFLKLIPIYFLGYFFPIPYVLLILLMHSIFNITILFFLDSDGSFKQLWCSVARTFTLVIYNVPLVSIVVTLEIISVFGYQALECYEIWWLAPIPFIMNIPLINLWTNFYIKKVHEQPDLYFDLPK